MAKQNFEANCIFKEPKFWFLAPKELIWQQPSAATGFSAKITTFTKKIH